MKPISNIKLFAFSLVFMCFSLNLNAQNTYIDKYKKLAMELSKQYGIPSAVILSVAFVETGGGTSKNSKTLNNHFGIVGKNNVNSSKYKSFASVNESYKAFCELITRKNYYNKLKGNNNHTDWLSAIASAGYSTQPEEWKRRINTIIQKFGLSE